MPHIPATLSLVIALFLVVTVVTLSRSGLKRRAEANGWPAVTRGMVKPSEGPLIAYQKLLNDVRGWGALWVALGVIGLVNAGASDPWSFVLVILGLMSFYFVDDPAIYILLITINLWLAFRNAATGQWFAVAIGVGLAALLAFQFARMRQALAPARRPNQTLDYSPAAAPFKPSSPFESAPSAIPPAPADPTTQPSVPLSGRAERFFPWLGLGLGLAAIGGYAVSYGLYYLSSQSRAQSAALSVELTVTLYAGLFSLGLALAALMSRFRVRAASVVGLSTAGLRIMFYLIAVLPRLFQRGGGPLT